MKEKPLKDPSESKTPSVEDILKGNSSIHQIPGIRDVQSDASRKVMQKTINTGTHRVSNMISTLFSKGDVFDERCLAFALDFIADTRNFLRKNLKSGLQLSRADRKNRDRILHRLPNGQQIIAVLGELHGDIASLDECEKIFDDLQKKGVRLGEVLFIGEPLNTSLPLRSIIASDTMGNMPPGAMQVAHQLAIDMNIDYMPRVATHNDIEVIERTAAVLAEKNPAIRTIDVMAWIAMTRLGETVVMTEEYVSTKGKRVLSVVEMQEKFIAHYSSLWGINPGALCMAMDNQRPEILFLARLVGEGGTASDSVCGQELNRVEAEMTTVSIEKELRSQPKKKYVAIFAGSQHIPSIHEGIDRYRGKN